MATNTSQGDLATATTETVEQPVTGSEQTPVGETPTVEPTDQDTEPAEDAAPGEDTESTKQDGNKVALLADLAKTRENVRALKTQITELEAAASTATKAMEDLAAVQKKYDRLEEFLSKSGGPMGRALDSRSFVRDLFESDKDISSIVTEWHAANPTATSAALGSHSAAPGSKAPTLNDLLRSAAK